jgi:hypothetical protein
VHTGRILCGIGWATDVPATTGTEGFRRGVRVHDEQAAEGQRDRHEVTLNALLSAHLIAPDAPVDSRLIDDALGRSATSRGLHRPRSAIGVRMGRATAAALALAAGTGALTAAAYAGVLPDPVQRVAHHLIDAPDAPHHSHGTPADPGRSPARITPGGSGTGTVPGQPQATPSGPSPSRPGSSPGVTPPPGTPTVTGTQPPVTTPAAPGTLPTPTATPSATPSSSAPPATPNPSPTPTHGKASSHPTPTVPTIPGRPTPSR